MFDVGSVKKVCLARVFFSNASIQDGNFSLQLFQLKLSNRKIKGFEWKLLCIKSFLAGEDEGFSPGILQLEQPHANLSYPTFSELMGALALIALNDDF